MHFMAVKKSRKRSGFVIYSYLQDTAFTAVERGMQSSKLVRGERGTLVNRTVPSPGASKCCYLKDLFYLQKGKVCYNAQCPH